VKWGHLFNRWDGPGERFNIEASNKGFGCYPDDYFRTGPYAIVTELDLERRCGYLKSKTPRQELAGFLMQRGSHWWGRGNQREAVRSYALASALDPDHFIIRNKLAGMINDWAEVLKRQEPPCFPETYLDYPTRRYPETLPLEFEKSIIWAEGMECMLNCPRMNKSFWEPMRNWRRLRKVPVKATIRPHAKGMNIELTVVDMM
jgi:hypothetical protein